MESLDIAEVISGENGPCRVLSFWGKLKLSLRKFSFGVSGELYFLLYFPALSFPGKCFLRAAQFKFFEILSPNINNDDLAFKY